MTQKELASFYTNVEAKRELFLKELSDFCRQPSISMEGRGMAEMAELCRASMEKIGALAEVIDWTNSFPFVIGEIGSGERTLLMYNHYDVMPEGDLSRWHSPPFEPARRDGKLFCRGVSDNKGNILARLQAIQLYRQTVGELPVRIRFIIEGEEELGSPHLQDFAVAHRSQLEADGCLYEGGSIDEAGRPLLYLGVKGMCSLELACDSEHQELHSQWGGVVSNPAKRLIQAVNSLVDDQGRPGIDGIWDYVQPPSEAEISLLEKIPFDAEAIQSRLGVNNLRGDSLALHALLFEPTCNINGLASGHLVAGARNIVPAQAVAKIDLRLVPDLTPELILKLLRHHLDRRGFTEIKITPFSAGRWARTPLDAPIVQATTQAMQATYQIEPVIYPSNPASGPMSIFTQDLGIPCVTVGVAYPGSNIHGPNEHIIEDLYIRGIQCIGEIIHRFGQS